MLPAIDEFVVNERGANDGLVRNAQEAGIEEMNSSQFSLFLGWRGRSDIVDVQLGLSGRFDLSAELLRLVIVTTINDGKLHLIPSSEAEIDTFLA